MVVLGCGAKPGLADSHTITTCCALRCLPQPLPASTLVIVELQLVQNLEIARQVLRMHLPCTYLEIALEIARQVLRMHLPCYHVLTVYLPCEEYRAAGRGAR